MSDALLVKAGRVAERRGWADPVLCDVEAIKDLPPAGPPILAVDRAGQVTDDQARALSALVGAGREVALITELVHDDLPQWIPSSAISHGEGHASIDWEKQVVVWCDGYEFLEYDAPRDWESWQRRALSQSFPRITGLWLNQRPQITVETGFGDTRIDYLTAEWDLRGDVVTTRLSLGVQDGMWWQSATLSAGGFDPEPYSDDPEIDWALHYETCVLLVNEWNGTAANRVLSGGAQSNSSRRVSPAWQTFLELLDGGEFLRVTMLGLRREAEEHGLSVVRPALPAISRGLQAALLSGAPSTE